ncbi:NADP-dependent 3-hydroxy acid dehydrogenase YdfG [Saccharopolyspora kobensis]|uniref:NADP-dependent 3-hydroxy acid dehydrogenase YdfG n=1 Tax=Saccharopolyspora kobensis TaxID=146035 RepID=A0A1H5TI34_9PSEU|nr:SDR family oxidoreductase [Saccharopolyspora kobensis]SEF62430.1 NADP-dependent 3-hydroxy acid dehydrogenase YdfG [Saccharopolyspora kobensis]SFC46209.1 NADP-dependent 3-hydroxy acid dehydrogenase YdfG [Saccharopolyspora kobensis]
MSERVLMITGASRGIGAATARAAAAAGYRLVLTARSADALSALVDELGPETALALPCDVTDYANLTEAVQHAEDRFGRLDAVFANAGTSLHTSFLGNGGAEPEQWRDMVLTNVYGAAITARAALPALARTEGHLLLTGSNAGRGIRPGNLYSATKWAVTGMAQNIRAECVGTGVRVTLIQPGMVETEMTEDTQDVPKLNAEDIANAALYALQQPPTVDVNELIIRPTGQQR